MAHLFSELSKYFLIILFIAYTYECFHVFRFEHSIKRQHQIYNNQRLIISLIHLDCFAVLYLYNQDIKLIGFYLMQLILFVGIFLIYRIFFKKASELLLNNLIMLLTISFIVLTRINFDKALKQFVILMVATAISFIVPVVLNQEGRFRTFTRLYALVGIIALALVLVLGQTSYGAKLGFSIGGISIQPSEFIKLTFVFMIASLLYQSQSLKQLAITSALAAIHVLILVASRDLGAALLFFVVYLTMIYVATKRIVILLGGIAFCSLAAVIGYFLFSHVQTRVAAWLDPLSVIDDAGFQVSQSLFAIGTGGWLGMGLCQGLPNKIPVVIQDFIFAAISEELGGIFAVCLILVCFSFFLMMLNIAMKMKDNFYRLVALGLSTTYGFQVFLTVGGAIKFIPSTGVTLPFISYGGSSILSSMLIFGIIQGLYIRKYSESSTERLEEERHE